MQGDEEIKPSALLGRSCCRDLNVDERRGRDRRGDMIRCGQKAYERGDARRAQYRDGKHRGGDERSEKVG